MENGKGSFGGREVVIVEATRTPIGRGHLEKGYYKDLHPSNLLAKVYGELFERTGVDPAETGDVVTGCAQQFGEQVASATESSPAGTPPTSRRRCSSSSSSATTSIQPSSTT